MTYDSHATQLRTFLIASLRAVPAVSDAHAQEAAAELAAAFGRVVHESVTSHGGEEVEMRGDEALVAFLSARQALRAAVLLRSRLDRMPRAVSPPGMQVGIGLDAGEVVRVADGYRGRALNLASRLSTAAEPGEVLASEGVIHLAGVLPELAYGDRRELRVKGFGAPVGVVPVRSGGVGMLPTSTATHGPGSEAGLRVRLLGAFVITSPAGTVTGDGWRLRKAATLVKLLALEPGHRMHRERLMDLLWPDSDPAAVGNNLHHVLHVARRSMEPADRRSPRKGASLSSEYLRLQGDVVSLRSTSGVWVDVEAFEAAASHARHSGDPEKYRVAFELYGGDLLVDDGEETPFADRRRALRTSFHGLLLDLARLEVSRRSYVAAIEVLRRATVSEPALEEAHVELMRLYARSGQRQGAIRQYEELTRALDAAGRGEPAAATTALYNEVVAGTAPILTRDAPEEEGGEPRGPRNNLPASLTSFIGREQHIVGIRDLLRTTRLLTLVGAGGAGKTRLAIAVARGLLDLYADGVWLVELAPVRDPSLVSLAVARTLSIEEEGGRELSQTIAENLRGREMLIILDNCEHLIERCALLAEELLSSCPRLRIVATSREPLDVPGEVAWLVPPLSLPVDEGEIRLEEIASAESVRLFVDRARYRQPTFALTADNAHAVSRICREVDGIPLAVELAAARIGVLSVEGIADRLVNALGLLTGGKSTGAQHHGTLRATLDWSYDILDGTERELFMRLSVFAGGWTLEQAETVGSGGSLDPGDILDVLSQLVDKSWVVAGETGESTLMGSPNWSSFDRTIRYRMLEPIRQYAREHLRQDSIDPDMPARSHALLFLALAEEGEYRLRGPEQRVWLARLEREHTNLQAALGWMIENGRLEAATRVALALERFWTIRGHASEAFRWYTALLERTAGIDLGLRARLLLAASNHLDSFGRMREADEEARSLARRIGDSRTAAIAAFHVGFDAIAEGDGGRAEALYSESLELARGVADPWERGYCLTGVAGLAYVLNRYDESNALYAEIRETMLGLGDARAVGAVQTALGINALASGDLQNARQLLEEAVRLCAANGDRSNWMQAVVMLARLAADEGDMHRAAAHTRDVLPHAGRLGAWGFVVIALSTVATLALRQGLIERATSLLAAVQRSYRDFGQPPVPAEGERTRELVAASRDALDEVRWSAAWDIGDTLSRADLVSFGLASLDLVDPRAEAASVQAHAENVLSGREREVAALIARGLTNRQIAARLAISERTADTHVGRILHKLGVSSRTQVAAWVTGVGATPR